MLVRTLSTAECVMEQYIQIDGTQLVQLVMPDETWPGQEPFSQSSGTVLQQPQSVLLTDGIKVLGYANPQTALYYHSQPQQTNSQQSQVVMKAVMAQPSTHFQAQQLQQFQGTPTLTGNQVIHSTILGDQYELSTLEEGQELEPGTVIFEDGSADSSLFQRCSDSAILARSVSEDEQAVEQLQIIQQEELALSASQPQLANQTAYNNMVQPQLINSVVPQLQPISVLSRTHTVQQQRQLLRPATPTYFVKNQTSSPPALSPFVHKQTPVQKREAATVRKFSHADVGTITVARTDVPRKNNSRTLIGKSEAVRRRKKPAEPKSTMLVPGSEPPLPTPQKFAANILKASRNRNLFPNQLTEPQVQSLPTSSPPKPTNITKRSFLLNEKGQLSDPTRMLLREPFENELSLQNQTLATNTLTAARNRNFLQNQLTEHQTQSSPTSSPKHVVTHKVEDQSSSSSLDPHVKPIDPQLILHQTPAKRIYSSPKARAVARQVVGDAQPTTRPAAQPSVSPAAQPSAQTTPQTTALQTKVVINDSSPLQKPNQVACKNAPLRVSSDQQSPMVFVVPPNRTLLQSNANTLRLASANKIVQNLNIENMPIAVDGMTTLNADESGEFRQLVVTSSGNVVVLSSGNALKPETTFVSAAALKNSGTDLKSVEPPRIIPGKVAVCKNCGIQSPNLSWCGRCGHRFPASLADCKLMDVLTGMILSPKKKDLHVGAEKLSNNRVFKSLSINAVSSEARKKPRAPRQPRTVPLVPECLTLSSDEEDTAADDNENESQENSADLEGETMDDHDSADERHCPGVEGGGLVQKASDGSLNSPHLLLDCRSVRIGSYKVPPTDKVVIADFGVELSVPDPSEDGKSVVLFINKTEMKRVFICFDRQMPCLFFTVKSSVGERFRELLNMKDPESEIYFDPDSKDESQKRVTILPEKLGDNNKTNLQIIISKRLLSIINYDKANELLVKAVPKQISASLPLLQNKLRSKSSNTMSRIQTILVYPPPPAKGGIPINTEDYACLGEDVFLNDVIIDFYLKYLMQSVLSPEERERTHVFSTFFYKRLTSPPAKSMRSSHPVESNPNLSPAEKRHSRVKSWTKNINIFTKDFIIIPINEKCHWFLAIICFPGQDGCVRMSDNSPVPKTPIPSSPTATAAATAAAVAHATAAVVAAAAGSSKIKVNSNNVLSIGSTTITPVKAGASDTITLDCNNGEEGSDRDEAEGDEEEMNEPGSEEEEETNNGTADSNPNVESTPKTEVPEKVVVPPPRPKPIYNRSKLTKEPIKQPCILIFDSLMGAPRARVVATLRDYLSIEHKVKQGKEKIFDRNTIKGMLPKVPQQKNFTDCGLYLLQYVEQFFLDPIQDYNSPIKSLKEWFSEEVVNRKRQDIQELLHELMAKQKVDISRLNLPELTFNSHRKLEDEEARLREAAEAENALESALAVSAITADVEEAVWGAAGGEEEVTTDGQLPPEEERHHYEDGLGGETAETEEELEEAEEGMVFQEEDEEAYEGEEGMEIGEGEEFLEEDGECPEDNQFQESAGQSRVIVHNMPHARLVNYPDSSESSQEGQEISDNQEVPDNRLLTLKRTQAPRQRRTSEIKKMRSNTDR